MAADGNGKAANGSGGPAPTDRAIRSKTHTRRRRGRRRRRRFARGGCCSEAGLRTACITKVISDALAYRSRQAASSLRGARQHASDDWAWHMYDTVKGSDWLGDQDSIEYMVAPGSEAVYELEHWGVPSRAPVDGRIYQRPFGGMTLDYGKGQAQRTCAAADRSGHAMLHTMYGQALAHSAEFYIGVFRHRPDHGRSAAPAAA